MEELRDKMVVVLTNSATDWCRGYESEGMLLGARLGDRLELLEPPPDAAPGDRVVVAGYKPAPIKPCLDPEMELIEKVSENMHVNYMKRATYGDISMQVEGKDGFITTKSLADAPVTLVDSFSNLCWDYDPNYSDMGNILSEHYDLNELTGRMVLILYNSENAWSRGMECSSVLIGAQKGNKLELLKPPPGTEPGDKVFVPGYGRGTTRKVMAPADPRNPIHSLLPPQVVYEFDIIAQELRVDADRRVLYRDLPLQVEGKDGFITTDTLTDCGIAVPPADEPLYLNQPTYPNIPVLRKTIRNNFPMTK